MRAQFNQRGSIKKLFVGEDNLVYAWGIEFADAKSFFSLEWDGWRTKKKVHEVHTSRNAARALLSVDLLEGSFLVLDETRITGNTIVREATLTAVEDSFLMDFVVRYRFTKRAFHHAYIGDRVLEHHNTNIYYQYPVTSAALYGEEFAVDVTMHDVEMAGIFSPFMYVRDWQDEWIVHCRLLPKVVAREVVKLNAPWYNRALPESLGNTLLRFPVFKKRFWYRAEKKRYAAWDIASRFFRPSAYPLAMLKKGQRLKIVSSCDVIQKT